MNKIIKLLALVATLSLLADFASAEVKTSCVRNESGVMVCNASESNLNVMNMQCKNSEAGQTNCSGDYTDKKTTPLSMNCSTKDGATSCSGGAGDGTTFKMNCTPNSASLLKCHISDNQGNSLAMDCKLNALGIPDCSGIDNQGVNHAISCAGTMGESANCSTN